MEKYISKNIKEDAHFLVSLDGLNLSQKQLANINNGIKNVVLKEIATIDTKGDLAINRRLDTNPKTFKWDFPILWGIWIEDFGRRIERFDLTNRLG